MNRQEANRLILKQISAMVEGTPELRFHQILHNLNIEVTEQEYDQSGLPTGKLYCKDLFHEESLKTLERMNKKDA